MGNSLRKIVYWLDDQLGLIDQTCMKHRGVMTLFFVLLYAIQQIVLILLLEEYPHKAPLIVALWSTIFLTVVSIEKVLLDKRLEYYKRNMYMQTEGMQKTLAAYNRVVGLSEELSRALNDTVSGNPDKQFPAQDTQKIYTQKVYQNEGDHHGRQRG